MLNRNALIIAFHYPPEGGSSGVLRTLKFSKYLPEFGWRPSVVTATRSAYLSIDEKLVRQIPAIVRVVRAYCFDARKALSVRGRYLGCVAIPDPFLSWLPFGVMASLRTIHQQNCRIIFSTSPIPTAHLIAAICHRLTGLPWIADFRDPWVEDKRYSGHSSIRTFVERRMESKVVTKATLVTVTTDLLKDEILGKYPGIPSKKIEVLPNGYDEADFKEFPVSDAPSAEAMEIIHTGYVDPDYRNPSVLLKAIAQLIQSGKISESRIRLTFLGGGDYPNSLSFKNDIESFRLGNVVRIHERVSYEECIRRLFEASVLLILQGGYDTRHLIPAKAFEYLRANRPLLALTDDGVTARLIREYNAGLVAGISDLDAIRSALLTLYSMFEKRSLKVNIDHYRLKRDYDRRNLTEKLASLFDRLLSPA